MNNKTAKPGTIEYEFNNSKTPTIKDVCADELITENPQHKAINVKEVS